ncbi:MAG: TlyA family rRNA (cytidine-2'-O)-methyltransferase [Nitrospinae bacterium]|nr:TlyA family rRNA (cytidine-2'-O)-methyltransferase [Nitrospinota bacterium]
MAKNKKRLDVLLVERGLAETRAKAQSMILSGNVYSGDKKLEKAGANFDDSIDLDVRGKEHPFVSRGGVKLSAALSAFAINPHGKKALDIGASTGGFTDCLLQNGATEVLALDAGKGQLDWKLRSDQRVKLVEGFNARNLTKADYGSDFGIVVIDVSFISLDLVLPGAADSTADGGIIIALVKPQFEAGREEVGKGGLVKDPAVQARAVEKIVKLGESLKLMPLGTIESPITGATGNREFLAVFLKTPKDSKFLVPRNKPFPPMDTKGTVFYPIVSRAAQILPLARAGVKMIQLRIKDLSGSELEAEIASAVGHAKKFNLNLFVNDYWELAIKTGAYGVHLGQEDLPGADLDAIQRAGLRLGVSTHDRMELEVAKAVRPSYVAFGPVFYTKLKAMRFAPQGVDRLKVWKGLTQFPFVAIGGITLENAPEVLGARPDFISVVGDVANAQDSETRARAWLEMLR